MTAKLPDQVIGNLIVHEELTVVSLPMRKVYDRNDLKVPCFGLWEVKSEFRTVVFPTEDKITSPACSILFHYAATEIHANLATYRLGGSVCSSEMFL